jgi:hypothetical protein
VIFTRYSHISVPFGTAERSESRIFLAVLGKSVFHEVPFHTTHPFEDSASSAPPKSPTTKISTV